jgi:CubicO group peptidase (beta-lactamase class C family)
MSSLLESGRVDGVIARTVGNRLVGAVVKISLEGELVFDRAAGFADRERRIPMQEDAIFLLSSLTKTIVSAGALALVERGMLGLEQSVTQWLPEFIPRTSDGSTPPISIRQLLTHTAGLGYGFMQPPAGPYFRAGVSDGLADHGLSLDEELRRIAQLPLLYVPGTDWGYSLALDVLGAVMSSATGDALPDVIQTLITSPLGMVDTSFTLRDPERLAIPYVDGEPPRRMADLEVVPFGDGVIRFSPSRISAPGSFASGGVGMAGTAGDFLKFLEAIRLGGAPILRPQSAQAMMINQIGKMRINVEKTPS